MTHFLIAIVVFFFAALLTGLPNLDSLSFDQNTAAPVIGTVSPCVVTTYEVDKDGVLRECKSTDPVGPAKAAGLQEGDLITAVNGTPIATYGALVKAIRSAPAGPTTFTYVRDGATQTATVNLVTTQRPPIDKPSGPVSKVSAAGIAVQSPDAILHYSLAEAPAAAVWYVGQTVRQTFTAIAHFPERIPNLVKAIQGGQRDPNSPVSVVGASRIGGESFQLGAMVIFLVLLGELNVFIGVFNLLPLLPLDGGHVAVAFYERIRSWLAARRGRPDPGRVDYNKLLPVTYFVVLLFVGLTVLTLTADVVNPIRLQP
jgi:membrane-associated protease RseP (regulator of RpoE activity)